MSFIEKWVIIADSESKLNSGKLADSLAKL